MHSDRRCAFVTTLLMAVCLVDVLNMIGGCCGSWCCAVLLVVLFGLPQQRSCAFSHFLSSRQGSLLRHASLSQIYHCPSYIIPALSLGNSSVCSAWAGLWHCVLFVRMRITFLTSNTIENNGMRRTSKSRKLDAFEQKNMQCHSPHE